MGKIVKSLAKLIMAHPNLHIEIGKKCDACDAFWTDFKTAVVDYVEPGAEFGVLLETKLKTKPLWSATNAIVGY